MTGSPAAERFQNLLREQVRSEFHASQQDLAIAVWFDGQDLPELAKRFYRLSLTARKHALMMVRHLLDSGLPVVVPGVDRVRNDFTTVHEPIEVALEQEQRIAAEITALARAARAEDNYSGEQFVQWFLAERVAAVAAMTTLRTVVTRAGTDLLRIEEHLVRDAGHPADAPDPTAPPAAGGSR